MVLPVTPNVLLKVVAPVTPRVPPSVVLPVTFRVSSTVVAPAVKAFAMTFEPALFIVDANSKIIDRLDAVFDAEEITEALSRAGVTTS